MPIKGSFYVITVMDSFSRAILSSDLFQSQDLSCVLIVLYAAIERFVTDYDAQPRLRAPQTGRSSPESCRSVVAGNGETAHPGQLHRIFYATRHLRRLYRLGYAHFRRWKLYGEGTLARHPAVIWVHGDALTVEYQDTPLAQYTVRYQPDHTHFKAIPEARRFETPYRSLQGQRMASSTKPCGSSPNVSLTTLLAKNAGKSFSRSNYPHVSAQSSFLLDRLHKLKAWSRRKFPVEEQGKPICVPKERGRQHQHAQSCFCPWHLLCLACSSTPTYSASRHFNASCSASCRAFRNLMPFPSFQETTARFPSKEVCKKVMGTQPSG